MPLTVQVNSASVPAHLLCKISNEHWQELAALLTVSFGANITFVNTGHEEPLPENRIWPWKRSNADGSPDKDYTYFEGQWVSPHPLKPGFGALHFTAENEAAIKVLDGGQDAAITDTTGPFWEVVTSMGGRFPVGPGAFAGGGSVAIGDTGGADKHTNTLEEMAPHAHVYTRTSAGGDANNGGANGIIVANANTSTVGGGLAYSILPPYRCLWFIQRTLRLHYLPT